MWKNKYFIISVIVCVLQLINFIVSVSLGLHIATTVLAGVVLLFVTAIMLKIAYDLHKEGWEDL